VNTVKITRATQSDYRRLLALDSATRRTRRGRQWLRRVLEERGVFVLADGGEMMAYGVVTKSFFGRPFVEMLYVAHNARRKGHGERLLCRLEAAGLRDHEVWVSTNQSNRPMQELLKKRGFVRCGRVMGLDAGDPELFYVKKSG